MTEQGFFNRRLGAAAGGLVIGCASLLALASATPTAASVATRAGQSSGTPGGASRLVSTVNVVHSATADSQSNNWSGYNLGYLSTGTKYTAISGTWKVPTATQHTAGQSENSASWIGIGGGCLNTSCTETDSTLIQAGTEQDVSKAGKASYGAWYELIPETETAEPIKIHPGDTIECSITSTSAGEWEIVLKDVTDGKSFKVNTAYSSSELTAEWIEETPVVVGTGGSGVAALPNLTTVHFSAAAANAKTAGLAAADAIQLTDSNGKPIATPSKPSSTRTAFNDCAWKTSCPSP